MPDPDQSITPRTHPRVSRAPVLVLLVGLGLAGGLVVLGATLAGAPAPTPDVGRPGTADAPRPVNVIMRDYRFDPTPIYLVLGETIRLNVVNGGLVEHELVLGDAALQRAWSGANAAATPPGPFATAPPASVAPDLVGLRLVLASGAASTVDYLVPSTGPVELVCHLPGHAERGMVGQVSLVTR
ncbi:MAG: hypothetical protein ACR2H0_06645 [Candidatus Limnocylindrales bacterium]